MRVLMWGGLAVLTACAAQMSQIPQPKYASCVVSPPSPGLFSGIYVPTAQEAQDRQNSCDAIVDQIRAQDAVRIARQKEEENQDRIQSERSALARATEERRRSEEWNAKNNQKIEDSRAMVRENWAVIQHSVVEVVIGKECGIADPLTSQAAIMRIQNIMQNELIRAGILGDSTMDAEPIIQNGIKSGKDAIQNGACAAMTPASRGRLREWISGLANS